MRQSGASCPVAEGLDQREVPMCRSCVSLSPMERKRAVGMHNRIADAGRTIGASGLANQAALLGNDLLKRPHAVRTSNQYVGLAGGVHPPFRDPHWNLFGRSIEAPPFGIESNLHQLQ